MMGLLSVSDYNYLAAAAEESKKSNLQSKHGCIAVTNGKIRGRGHNSNRTQSYDGFIANTCSCHAEVAALRDLWHSNCTNTHGKFHVQSKGQCV